MNKLEIIASKAGENSSINLREIISAGLAGISAGTFACYKILGNFGEEYDDAKKNLRPKKIIADMKNDYHLIYEFFKKAI